MREPFPVDLVQQRKGICTRQASIAVDGAVLPAESAVVVGLKRRESPRGVPVLRVAEVELIFALSGDGVDVERNVEGFALGLIVGFFGTAAEVGGVVPSGVVFPARVVLLPDCSWHGASGGEKVAWTGAVNYQEYGEI